MPDKNKADNVKFKFQKRSFARFPLPLYSSTSKSNVEAGTGYLVKDWWAPWTYK